MPEQGRDGTTTYFPWITDEHKARAIDVLTRRRRRRTGELPRPINDYMLGRLAGVPGNGRESIRRRSRELRRVLEAEGLPIVCIKTSKGGAYLAQDAADHVMYRAALEREAKRQLARAGRLKCSPAAADAAGQLAMFDTMPSSPTSALCGD
jgi:hypothetical protein